MNMIINDPHAPRYTDRLLPEYRHLPFQNPHPFLDEDGHSFGEQLTPAESFAADNWMECEEYLYSIDLFNHGYWWEAHERLKHVSTGAGRKSEAGVFIQGLIQISAALLKYSMEEYAPAKTLAELGLGNLAIDTNPFLGIDVVALKRAVLDCLAAPENGYPSLRLAGIRLH
ncbi:MAG: DUF309 domain-containing protein [Deltaproteobacteria bacterium]|nr:DUF309 domain-containing protein [Deltaproteobacteria bacterium]MCW9049746.1 DUF309 domain-containing protein [Deltaproteobacteria bacterium]